jgi:hypothetical protein
MTFKKLLLSLSVLSMVGCGSYTQLFDPNREPPTPKPEIIKPQEIKDDGLPQSRKDYYAERLGRDREYRYTAWDRYTGYVFRPYPYESEVYIYRNNSQHRFINLEVDESTTPQVYKPQQTVAPATSTYDSQVARVWQKRISPRVREAPTPTRRQKDGE